MKSFITTLLFIGLAFNQHFTVNIDETGSSTLFIFEDSISSLSGGDEIGLFDSNGIIDSDGNETSFSKKERDKRIAKKVRISSSLYTMKKAIKHVKDYQEKTICTGCPDGNPPKHKPKK